MKYIALNLFLGCRPSWTAMLVSCGRPCIYIKIVQKISPLFMPWVCKLILLSVSCRQGIEVGWRLSLHLWFLVTHHGSLLVAAQPPKGSNPSPFPWADGVPCTFGFLTQATAKMTWMEYLLYPLGESCLPYPHSEWLLNLCWSCVAIGSMFISHCLVGGLEKKNAWLLGKHQGSKYEPNNKAK